MTAKNIARRPKKFFGFNFSPKFSAVLVFRVRFFALQDCSLLLFDSGLLPHCGVSFKVRNSAPSLTVSVGYLVIYINVRFFFIHEIFSLCNADFVLISVSLIVLSQGDFVMHYKTASREKLQESDLTYFLGYSPSPLLVTSEQIGFAT